VGRECNASGVIWSIYPYLESRAEMELKRFFVEELKRVYSERIATSARAEAEAAQEADHGKAEARRREDAKEAMLQGRLATGHRKRRLRAVSEMERLLEFAEGGIRRFRRTDRVDVGALVDVRIEDEKGDEERTHFLLPVGAGVELTGPGGDGFVVVVTPQSPVGKALMKSRVDDSFEIVVDGRDREWTVLDLG
jgi:transcription elongation GreA/GreB family factor